MKMEYGVGIHGEPGIRREKILSADQLGERMVKELTRELGIRKAKKQNSSFGQWFRRNPLQELYILNRAVRQALEEQGIEVLYNLRRWEKRRKKRQIREMQRIGE